MAEDAEVADGEIRRGDIDVLVFDVARGDGLLEFEVGVGAVALFIREVGDGGPRRAVGGGMEFELRIDVRPVRVDAGLVVGEVHLHGADIACATEIDSEPFAGFIRTGDPVAADVFVGDIRGREDVAVGRRRDGLAIREKHPAGEEFLGTLPFLGGQMVRQIAEARGGVHQPVIVERGREHRDAALEVEVHREPGRAGIPIVAVIVLERIPVTRAGDEAAGLVADGIIRRVGERAERAVAHVGAVRIDVVFRAGRAVLEIVFAAMLGHPRAFHEGRDGAGVIRAEAFPAVALGLELEELGGVPEVGELVRRVELDAVERIQIRRAEIHEPALGLGIVEDVWIPRALRAGHLWEQGIEVFEATRLRCIRNPDGPLAEGGLKEVEASADGQRSGRAHVFLGPLMR